MNETDEEAARRLFTVAAEDIPPGIDLLAGVRKRRRARRMRTRALLCAGTAGITATAAAVALSLTPAPSALAQVTQAAARTAGQSYRITSTTTILQAPGDKVQQSGVIGEFDPARGVGEETRGQTQIRFVGSYMYLRASFGRPNGKPWTRFPASLTSGQDLSAAQIALLGLNSAQIINPQDLLAQLKSASQVRYVGNASGPGWTGSEYAFTATQTAGKIKLSTSGTVDVDQQGRVRRLDATGSLDRPSVARRGPWNVVRKVVMTFGDFGLHVSVSAPPASEVFILRL